MSYRAITLHLPESLLSAAEAAAHGQSISLAQLLRQALAGAVGQDGPAREVPPHRFPHDQHAHLLSKAQDWTWEAATRWHVPAEDEDDAAEDDFDVIDWSDRPEGRQPTA